MSQEAGTYEAKRRKLFVLVDEIGLTPEERIQLGEYLLRRDLASWKGLSEEQIGRLLDAMEGYQLIDQLLTLRAPPPPRRDTTTSPSPGSTSSPD